MFSGIICLNKSPAVVVSEKAEKKQRVEEKNFLFKKVHLLGKIQVFRTTSQELLSHFAHKNYYRISHLRIIIAFQHI